MLEKEIEAAIDKMAAQGMSEEEIMAALKDMQGGIDDISPSVEPEVDEAAAIDIDGDGANDAIAVEDDGAVTNGDPVAEIISLLQELPPEILQQVADAISNNPGLEGDISIPPEASGPSTPEQRDARLAAAKKHNARHIDPDIGIPPSGPSTPEQHGKRVATAKKLNTQQDPMRDIPKGGNALAKLIGGFRA